MFEVRGNLWTYPADVRVITTNGTVKKNGECVMGRGCAAEAKNKWPELPKELGDHISRRGNIPYYFPRYVLYSFPVKHQWMQQADPELIKTSAKILSSYVDQDEFKVVLLPRPGCGNGGLKWEDVKPVLEPILDDRFYVITF